MVIQQYPTTDTVARMKLVAGIALRALSQIGGVIPDIVRCLHLFTAVIAVAVIRLVFSSTIRAEQM
jgi:hypothetical protein